MICSCSVRACSCWLNGSRMLWSSRRSAVLMVLGFCIHHGCLAIELILDSPLDTVMSAFFLQCIFPKFSAVSRKSWTASASQHRADSKFTNEMYMALAHMLGMLLYVCFTDACNVAGCHRSDTVVRTESRWICDFGPFWA